MHEVHDIFLAAGTCFQVKAKYIGAKNAKGIRAAVYRAAVDHQACFLPDRSKSIYYDKDSSDLKISLLFRTIEMALKFQAYLETWHLNSLVVKYGDVCREEEVKPITVAEHSLVQVHLDDYVALDYESPLQSLEDFLSLRASLDSTSVSTSSASNLLTQLQSLEPESFFVFQNPYKCHIKPKVKVKSNAKLKKSSSNLITLTQSFHNFFRWNADN